MLVEHFKFGFLLRCVCLAFFSSGSHFQSEFHYVPVCMEIFSIIFTFFARCLNFVSDQGKAKQMDLMISTRPPARYTCVRVCASVFDGIWICNFFCLIVASFPFFVHPYQKFDIRVGLNKTECKSERNREQECKKGKRCYTFTFDESFGPFIFHFVCFGDVQLIALLLVIVPTMCMRT